MPAPAAPIRRLLTAALIAAALPVTADGQVRVVRRADERLKGITTVDVVVNGVDGTASRCGLDKSLVLQESARVLNGPGLRATMSERASSWFYTVEIDIRSDLMKGRCATALATGLIAHVDGIPEADRYAPPEEWGSLLVADAVLIHELSVVQSEASSHAAAVTSSLRKQLSAIAERIRRANP